MVKDVLCAIDYSAYAEAALVLFAAVFGAVGFCLTKLTGEWSRACAAIPLDEGEAEQR
ncbi:MAG TPA: hypothetical protein VF170_14040 [Planctomycetaceae bacterium]